MEIFCADSIRQRNEEGRSGVWKAPKYQIGVLEEGWQYRSKGDDEPQPRQYKRQSLPPFKGCSIYKTSYRPPAAASYERDLALWHNKEKAEGQSKELLEGGDKACLENFTTTTDLVYRILPQLCPKLRQYNSNALEWFPPQNFLRCYGNLTQHGLKEAKRAEWDADVSLISGTSLATGPGTSSAGLGTTPKLGVSTYWDHYRKPPQKYFVTERRALSRLFSSSVDPNNKAMANQLLRGKRNFQVPILDPSKIPMPECRYPLPILPTLPEDPPYRIGPRPPESLQRSPPAASSALQTRPLQQYPLQLPVQVC